MAATPPPSRVNEFRQFFSYSPTLETSESLGQKLNIVMILGKFPKFLNKSFYNPKQDLIFLFLFDKYFWITVNSRISITKYHWDMEPSTVDYQVLRAVKMLNQMVLGWIIVNSNLLKALLATMCFKGIQIWMREALMLNMSSIKMCIKSRQGMTITLKTEKICYRRKNILDWNMTFQWIQALFFQIYQRSKIEKVLWNQQI